MATEQPMIPILFHHRHDTPPIGLVFIVDGRFMIEFSKDFLCTQEMLWAIFGGAGVHVLDMYELAGQRIITKAEIQEFSFCGLPASAAAVPNHNSEAQARDKERSRT